MFSPSLATRELPLLDVASGKALHHGVPGETLQSGLGHPASLSGEARVLVDHPQLQTGTGPKQLLHQRSSLLRLHGVDINAGTSQEDLHQVSHVPLESRHDRSVSITVRNIPAVKCCLTSESLHTLHISSKDSCLGQS